MNAKIGWVGRPSFTSLVRSGLFVLLACTITVPIAQGADNSAAHQKMLVSDARISEGLAAQGGKLIADYGSSQLWAAPARVAATFATKEGVTLQQGEDVIELQAGYIDTSRPTPSPATPVENFSGKRLHLFQFAGPIKPDWHAALLAQGFRVVAYVPRNAYLVYGDTNALAQFRARAAGSPHVQWEGPYLAEHKIHPRAQAALQKAAQNLEVDDLFQVQLVEDVESNASSLQFLEQVRREMVRQWAFLGYLNVTLRLPPERLTEVAALTDVVSIQVYAEPRKRDERQDQILAGNLTNGVPNGPGYLAWLAGKGLTAEQFATSGFGVDVS